MYRTLYLCHAHDYKNKQYFQRFIVNNNIKSKYRKTKHV